MVLIAKKTGTGEDEDNEDSNNTGGDNDNSDSNDAGSDPNYPGNGEHDKSDPTTGDGTGTGNGDGTTPCLDCGDTDYTALITNDDINQLNLDLGFNYSSSYAFYLRSLINRDITSQLIGYLELYDTPEQKEFIKTTVIGLADGITNNVHRILNERAPNNFSTLSPYPYVKYPEDKIAEYISNYPKFTAVLRNDIPNVANNDVILNAINGLTDAPIDVIKDALKWGNGPEIIIEQLGTNESGDEKNGVYRGHLFENAINILFIDVDLVLEFEQSDNDELSDALGFLLAVTVLHEYVHFADMNYGDHFWGELFLSEGGLENEAGVSLRN